jgi:hypothetical protein
LSDPTPPDLNLNPFASSPPPRFRVPADYYAAPTLEVRPVFPRGVKIGCGVASAALLLIIFAAGAIVAHRGIGKLMDPLLGMMSDEIGSMYAKDVTPPQRKALAGEITTLREGIRSGRVPVAKLDPIMSSLREAIRDQRLTQAETEKLRKEIHAVNTAPTPASKKRK